MPSIAIRFDAQALKNQIKDRIEGPIMSLTKDPELYTMLAESFIHYGGKFLAKEVGLYDTGALSYGNTGTPKGRKENVVRVGHNYVRATGHDYGAVFDPVEYYNPLTPKGHKHIRHYGAYAIENAFTDGRPFKEQFKSSGFWKDFTEDARKIIVRRMKEKLYNDSK